MKGRVLVAGLLVALAAALAGCVAQTTGDDEDSVEDVSAAFGSALTGDEGDDGIESTGETAELPTRGTTTAVAPVKFDGQARMGEPIPVPWTPPVAPSPGDQSGTTSKNR